MKQTSKLLPAMMALALAGCGPGGGDPMVEAQAAYDAGDYQAARIALVSALEKPENMAEATPLYARTLLALGDGEGAQRIIGQLRNSANAPVELDAMAAHAAFLRGDFDEALNLTGLPGAQNPQGAWVAIRALTALDRNEAALEAADAAVETYPQDARLLATRGAMALAQRQVAAAKDWSLQALEADEAQIDALMLAGQLRLLRSDYAGAREFYASAHEHYPADLDALFALAAVEADLGNADTASDHLQALLSAAPGHPLALLLQARLAFVEGDLDEAQAILQGAEADIGRIPNGRLLMGEIAYLRGFPSQAIVHLREFLGMQPGHLHASTVLAQAYAGEGEARRAFDLIAPLADSATATPQLLSLASRLSGDLGEEDRFALRLADERPEHFADDASAAQEALLAGNAERAEQLYAALLEQGGESDAVILNNAAHASLGVGNKAEALRRARAAHALAPRDPRVADTLGWALLENGEAAAGLRHLETAVAAMPGNLQIRWHYANALIANGRAGEARPIIRDMREFAGAEQRAAMDELLARL